MMDGQGTQTQGAQASTGGGGWASDLQKLAGHTEAAEQQKGGGASIDDVKGLLGGSSSGKLLAATGRRYKHYKPQCCRGLLQVVDSAAQR